jgi:hypothetical protein
MYSFLANSKIALSWVFWATIGIEINTINHGWPLAKTIAAVKIRFIAV